MLPRFYLPDAGDGTSCSLPLDESHHALKVLRLRAGDALAVFDGRGHEWSARIASASKTRVDVQLLDRIEPAPEPRVRVTLIQSVLKGEHMDAVIRDATMLGVAAIRPVITQFTVVSAAAASSPRAQERWSRVAIASAKQCRRAVVPRIEPVRLLNEALELACEPGEARIALVEPAMHMRIAGEQSGGPARACLAIGPEGGWGTRDAELLGQRGFVRLTLGSLTLRADAAAMVALSALRSRWNDF